ncbi:MAG: NTP transferase domain-containing protein [Cyclobacteriaceae bacterium]
MIAIIILAAGEARRMGQPKQLMKIQGQSLVRRAVRTAQLVSEQVVVVTGAYQEPVWKEVATLGVTTVHNAEWASGMGSSISTGIQKAMSLSPVPSAAIIMLCDQPLVDEELLKQLIKVHKDTRKPLVASAYRDVLGVPALFAVSLFRELLKLQGKIGAQKVIARYVSEAASVDFPQGSDDVDTPEDYARVQKLLS